jgi:pimeloyl-ACP methyl ester carboxylesterase
LLLAADRDAPIVSANQPIKEKHMKSSLAYRILAALTLLLTLTLLSACEKEADTAAPDALTVVVDSVASADSVMIYYDTRGAGDKTLVFVHCWSCDRSYWSNQVDVFAENYRVVTIDLGGHGQSGLEREAWTMEAFGADVAAVMQKLDLSNTVIIGHSMGGPVAMEAARLLPDRVVGLVGVDNFQNLAAQLTPEQVQAFMDQVTPDFVAATDQFVRSMFPAEADTALVEQIVADMTSAPPEVGLSSLENVLGYDYLESISRVRLPIRTISSDRYPTEVSGNRAAAVSFELSLMPGSGHFPHLENPEVFNQLLTVSLDDLWLYQPGN